MKQIKVGKDVISVPDNTDELSYIKGYTEGIKYARKVISKGR